MICLVNDGGLSDAAVAELHANAKVLITLVSLKPFGVNPLHIHHFRAFLIFLSELW